VKKGTASWPISTSGVVCPVLPFPRLRPAGGVLLEVGRRRDAPALGGQFQAALLVDDGVVAACRGPEHPFLGGGDLGGLDVVLLYSHGRSRAVLVDVDAQAGPLADEHDVVVVQWHHVPDLLGAVTIAHARQRVDLKLGLTRTPTLGGHDQAGARFVAEPVCPTRRKRHDVPLLPGPHGLTAGNQVVAGCACDAERDYSRPI
jgi:hypothetical protein